MNKRDRRRLKREAEHGPEREIVEVHSHHEVLSCGHVLENPVTGTTKLMKPPKFRRCAECLNENESRD